LFQGIELTPEAEAAADASSWPGDWQPVITRVARRIRRSTEVFIF
jgi:hypothetical protein